uniref:Rel homology dimerisation domain-containing protein n=1 Tax=Romanomermis culicivorax TaxID=13658 RepID=A0A915JPW4_ROMCU
QIKIRFCDTVIDWESDALFSANDVYEQILIIFKTPPYHNINMNNRTTVHVRLYRPTDGEYSPPVEFVYLPLDHDCSTGTKIRSLDSGLSTMQSTDCVGSSHSAQDSTTAIKSPGHVLSNQIKSLSLMEETEQKNKMDVQLEALWSFCENGDMTSLVAANKEIIAAQDNNGNT